MQKILKTGEVHWFAALPSAKMTQAASSGNVIHNMIAIANMPLYDKIIFVRTDGP